MNEKLFQDYENVEWKDITKKLKSSHDKLISIIEAHSAAELETKHMYKWTGTTNMASYFASVSSSHYVWASDLLEKHFKK